MATDTPPSFPKQGGGSASKKKVLMIGGIAVGGGLLGILYFRRKNSTAASTANPATDPNAIDPNTGVPYSQEGMYASGIGTTPGALGTYNPLTGQYTPGLGTTPQVSVPASNAQWAQAAEAALVAEGFDPVAAATAIGRYLQGSPLSANQYDIVTAALGLESQPPGGAPPVIQQIATGNSSGSTTPAPQPAAPNQSVPKGPGDITGGPGWLSGLFGTNLQQALTDLQTNGITVNTVQHNGANVNPASYMNSPVQQLTYFGAGQAGKNFANSVTIGV